MRAQTPRGVKDFLPDDALWKVRTEQAIRDVFERWNYREVLSPAFEFFETLALGDSTYEQTLKFLDQNGQLLALRPDMTTPIARMAATRFRDEEAPLRFSYLANVFRARRDYVGRDREFFQAGVECMGVAGPAADAEVLALAVDALDQLGVESYQIGLGHVQFLNGLMEECPDAEARHHMRQALLTQDYVCLSQLLENSPLPAWVRDVLSHVARRSLSIDELHHLRRQVRSDRVRQAVDNISGIVVVLDAHGLTPCVRLDLGMLKSLDYYTGMVFEGYVPELGCTLFSGGRYDDLLGRFGRNRPAVGFALELERLMQVLEKRRRKAHPTAAALLVCPEERSRAVQYARQRRRQGDVVEVDVQDMTREQALKYAGRKGFTEVAFVSDADIELVDPTVQGGTGRC